MEPQRVSQFPHVLAAAALLLSALGALIFCEVLRPFRSMSIDGPIALACWGVGVALAIWCFFLRGRSLLLTVIVTALNALPLLAALILLWLISQSNFAWH